MSSCQALIKGSEFFYFYRLSCLAQQYSPITFVTLAVNGPFCTQEQNILYQKTEILWRSLMSECNLEEVSVASGMQEEQVPSRLPSYRPYPWAFANQVLDVVDTVTGGRAGVCQRFVTYVVIGGFAALVNLAVFYLVFDYIKQPPNDVIRNVIASVLAAEISIMANFIPNDFVTFRHLPGRARSWKARC